MDLATITIIILFVLLGIQQVFWMRNVQRMVDKSMSRSYHEYVQAEKERLTPIKPAVGKFEPKIEDDYATEQAEAANRTFGLL